jgi:hypothetical protein
MIPENTYLLTSSGWNVIQNLTIGQKIFGLLNQEFLSTTITKIEKIKYTGKIYTLNKSQLLPNTKILTKKGRLQKISNTEDTKNIKKLCPHYNYHGYKINPIEHSGHLFDTCLIMKIIGYFVECGFLKNKEIIFKNSEFKLNHISKTLKQLNIKNNLYTTNKGTLLYSKDKYLYDFLIQFHYGMSVYGPYKYIPRNFLTLDKCYLEYLLCSMFSSSTGQNVILKPGDEITPNLFQFITGGKLLTNNLHEIIIKLGYYFNTTIIYPDPMRREQYDPLTTTRYGVLTTFMCKSISKKNIIQTDTATTVYTIYTDKKLKFTLIRNNSKPLFINL